MRKGDTERGSVQAVIQAGFHAGRTILMLAGVYHRPLKALLEPVQNAIDEDARNIYIKVDVQRKMIFYADDGNGQTPEAIQKRFQHIAEQQKTGKLGHKGIGNLASLAISEGFTLITRPRNTLSKERFFTIELNRAGLETDACRDEVTLPMRREPKDFRPGHQYHLGSEFGISTLLIVNNVQAAAFRQIKEAASIAREIENAFGTQILAKKIRIIVQAGGHKVAVQPKPFPGEAQEITIETGYGNVRFEMYVTTRPEKQPRLFVVHGKTKEEQYRLSLEPFLVDEQAKEIFHSGYLQGLVYVPFCTLTPDREDFEADNELAALWEVLADYSRTYGRVLIDKIAEERKEDRIQKILLQALRRVDKFLANHPELEEFFKGHVTPGHTDSDHGKGPAKRVRKVPFEPRGPREPEKEPRQPPSGHKPHEVHGGTLDETIAPKKRLRGQRGIDVTYRDPLPDEPRNWCSKRQGSLVIVNSLSEQFRKVEANNVALENYVFHLILKEVTLTALDDESVELFNETFERHYIPALVDCSTQSSKA